MIEIQYNGLMSIVTIGILILIREMVYYEWILYVLTIYMYPYNNLDRKFYIIIYLIIIAYSAWL